MIIKNNTVTVIIIEYDWQIHKSFVCQIIRNGKKQNASILAFIIRWNNGNASFVKRNRILHVIKIQKFNATINISDANTMMRMVKNLAVYSIDATREKGC